MRLERVDCSEERANVSNIEVTLWEEGFANLVDHANGCTFELDGVVDS